jgi:hypothetical protein
MVAVAGADIDSFHCRSYFSFTDVHPQQKKLKQAHLKD